MKVAFVFTSILVAACGSDSTTPTQKDAAGSGSGSNTANTVTTVSCTGITPTATVTMSDPGQMKYTYSTGATLSITAGQVVEFQTTAAHDVNPSPASATVKSDPGLKVGFSADVCLKFSAAGAFNFYCSRHGFVGLITVN